MANSNVLSQKSGKSSCQTRVRQTIVNDVHASYANSFCPIEAGPCLASFNGRGKFAGMFILFAALYTIYWKYFSDYPLWILDSLWLKVKTPLISFRLSRKHANDLPLIHACVCVCVCVIISVTRFEHWIWQQLVSILVGFFRLTSSGISMLPKWVFLHACLSISHWAHCNIAVRASCLDANDTNRSGRISAASLIIRKYLHEWHTGGSVRQIRKFRRALMVLEKSLVTVYMNAIFPPISNASFVTLWQVQNTHNRRDLYSTQGFTGFTYSEYVHSK